jgi:hypothetical protein
MNRVFLVALLTAIFMCGAAVVYAQDDTATADDSAGDDTGATTDDATDDVSDDDGEGFAGTIEFNAPAELKPTTQYQFEFKVSNTTNPNIDGTHWIYLVEMFMPNLEYLISADINVPDSLHGGGEWTADLFTNEANEQGILWEFNSQMTSAAYGDIQEGDFLDFSFAATTDAAATDGFDWRLETDMHEFATGTAYVGTGVVDDDTEPVTGDDDDDDDDDGGCGC